MSAVNAGRRKFLVTSAGATAGLIIGFHVPLAGRFALAQEAAPAKPALPTPNAFLEIAPDGTVTRYEHDLLGNRLAETGPRGQIRYAYDAAGRLMNAGAARFTYDPAGNMTARADASGRATYRYDQDNRLVEASVSVPSAGSRSSADRNGERAAPL